MTNSIIIYDDVNSVKNFFRHKIYNDIIGKKNHCKNIFYFNTKKYSNQINVDSDLGHWIKNELKIIDTTNGQLFILDDIDKIIQLRDKIWNDEINNELISSELNSITFAYEVYHWIKKGNQLYFYIMTKK
jgi:hypothetical protein